MQDVSVDVTTETSQTIEVRLRPAGYTEQLVVTATRSEQRIADVPASVNVVTNEQIEQSPAVVADDVLRQVPTFSLFRRTSSIAANPTAQGVSLRGIGPSGVSRTLVLLDDIPFNDPFGGWVYWTRVPMMNAERIEIIDGASSSLYGNYAMGGVINIVTNRPAPRTVIFKPQYGNRSTPKMDLFASHVWGRFGVTFDATTLQTDGYEIVAEEERGAIDNEANVEYQNVSAKARLQPDRSRERVLPRRASSTRSATTARLASSTTRTGSSAAAARACRLADGSNVEARLFYDNQDFFQNTFAVPAATPAAQPEQSVAREDRADHGGWHDGHVVAPVPARCPRARGDGRHGFPEDRRRQRRAHLRARDRLDAARPPCGRRHAAVRRRVCAGSD